MECTSLHADAALASSSPEAAPPSKKFHVQTDFSPENLLFRIPIFPNSHQYIADLMPVTRALPGS
jgi:hypothetical protein